MTPTVAILVTDITSGDETYYTIVGTTTVTTLSKSPLVAQRSLIRVAWKSSDYSRFTPASAPLRMMSTTGLTGVSSMTPNWIETAVTSLTDSWPSVTTTSSSESVAPTGTGASYTNQTVDQHYHHRLSSSQLTGIEVGSVLAFVLILWVSIWLYLRSKLARRKH